MFARMQGHDADWLTQRTVPLARPTPIDTLQHSLLLYWSMGEAADGRLVRSSSNFFTFPSPLDLSISILLSCQAPTVGD